MYRNLKNSTPKSDSENHKHDIQNTNKDKSSLNSAKVASTHKKSTDNMILSKGLFKQTTSIKLSDYFQIVKPKYVYIKVTPDKSVKNNKSHVIAKTIQSMHKTIDQLIYRKNKGFVFNLQTKCCYIMDISKNNISFYFLVPEAYLNLIVEKITEVWSRITVERVSDPGLFSENSMYYQVCYKKEDALSLNVNKKLNEPLNSLMDLLEIVEDKDRLSIVYNFIPRSQVPWTRYYDSVITRLKKKLPVEKTNISPAYIVKDIILYGINVLDNVVTGIRDVMGGVEQSEEQQKNEQLGFIEIASDILNNNIEYTTHTKKKRNSTILNTQILVSSTSEDDIRQRNNAITACQSLKVLDEDNELTYRKIKNYTPNLERYKFDRINENQFSTDECGTLLQLPGRSLLDAHSSIDHIDTLEMDIPKELQKGVMCLGTVTYKGDKKRVYFSTDKSYGNLSICLVGPSRAGKSTLIQNLSKNAIDAGECVILFDFCGNCELSGEVSSVFPASSILNIDCSDFEHLQGLSYNEAEVETDNWFIKYENAKSQASQVMTLVNSINSEDKDLSGRMDRFLEAAALAVFISNKKEKSLNDVFNVLRDADFRNDVINAIPQEFKEQLEDYVSSLRELDDIKEVPSGDLDDKGKPIKVPVTSTKLSYVNGILDRVNKLKRNTYMELMLKHDNSNNFNLLEEIQKSQIICLKMPEKMFKTETEKDIFCTYWITKIWLALQIRKSQYQEIEDFDKNAKKVNIFIDELYQVPHTGLFLKSKLSQIAKFKGRPIISCHHINQIKSMYNELKSANASYMLLSGCNKENYAELKEELEPFEFEDLKNLPRYHSLNLVKYSQGYARCITKMPPPITSKQ